MSKEGRNGGEKTGGRTKGTPNSITVKAREVVMLAIDSQSQDFNKVMNIIKEKNPQEWAKIMVKLMDFVLPKKVDVTTDGESLNKEPSQIRLSNGTVIQL